MQLNQNILRYGQQQDLPVPLELQAGSLSLDYADGFPRYLKLGDLEVLRMINHLVRDENWNTVPQQVYDEKVEVGSDSFNITYRCRACLDDVDFIWDCELDGSANNTVTFSITGKAQKTFKRNRIGFTVLHPNHACSGQPVTITHSDGEQEDCKFPDLISPHQPFMDITALRWKVGDAWATLQFYGEIFETEDQRNWTDDSYKTYCTPLSLPFPKTLEAGQTVSQKIVLSISQEIETSATNPSNDYYFQIDPSVYKLPNIGISKSSEVSQLNDTEISQLKAVSFDHYQLDLPLYADSWWSIFESGMVEAQKLSLKLELSLFFEQAANEIVDFIEGTSSYSAEIATIHVFDHKSSHTSDQTLHLTVEKLKSSFPQASVGSGTNAFFTELNRNRINYPGLDHLVYSINPQVHAFDNSSLIETLYAQPDTVRTAKSFSAEKGIYISPITLKMRWNPNATSDEEDASDNAIDPRQVSLFGAGWTLGSIHNLIGSGVSSLTYFETVGAKGIMKAAESSQSSILPSPYALYPVYLLFQWLLDRKKENFRVIRASNPLAFGGVVVGDQEMVLANYTNNTLKVTLPSEFFSAQVTVLHSDNIVDLLSRERRLEDLGSIPVSNQTQLAPFALAFYQLRTDD